jgi:hypothetical protein
LVNILISGQNQETRNLLIKKAIELSEKGNILLTLMSKNDFSIQDQSLLFCLAYNELN